MRRKIIYSLLTIFLIISISLLSISLWALGTSGGARWLLSLAARHYSVAMGIEKIEGRLWDEIRLKGIRIGLESNTLEIESLSLNWHPLELIIKRNLVIDRFTIDDKDMTLSASGDMSKRLNFIVNIADLSGIASGMKGIVHSEGWFRDTARNYEGEISLESSDFSAYGISFSHATFNGFLLEGKEKPLQIKTVVDHFEYSPFQLQNATLLINGTIEEHNIESTFSSAQSIVELFMKGEYKSDMWEGTIERLYEKDPTAPWALEKPSIVYFSPERIAIQQFFIKGMKNERFALDLELQRIKQTGSLTAAWEDINLLRSSQWFKDLHIAGKTSGSVETQWHTQNVTNLLGWIDLTGTYNNSMFAVGIKNSKLQFDGGEKGLQASLSIDLSDGGNLKGHFNSASPLHLDIPEKGDLEMNWAKINLSHFRTIMPEDLSIIGMVDGQIEGSLLPDRRFDVKSRATLTHGSLGHQLKKGAIAAGIQAAELSLTWRNTEMSADVSVLLSEQGKINGNITLPLSASIPPKFNDAEQVKSSIKGNIREKGLLSALFPGLMQESKGDIKADIKMEGSWEEPHFYGTLSLKHAGAYIPSAGITIKNARTEASFEKNMVRITQFSAVSGKGSVSGNAELMIRQWKIKNFQGKISGNDFQTIYLPELQVISSPDLKFSGEEDKLSINGDILIPKLLISGEGAPEIVKPSSDIYIVDAPEAEQRKPYFDLDLKVRIALGKKVLIRKAGVKAQLDGDIEVTGKSFSEMNARGLINITKGTYKRYGIDLEITRGRIIFSGGPVENPDLDILALRKVGDVHAGISVSGSAQSPVVALYAKPSMPDTDIIAYIVLGRPLGKSGEDSKLLLNAANILLSQSESASLQDQFKDIAGLDVLEIESKGEDVSRSILTIGKYLTPELYISYGQSLAEGGDVVRLRYSISKRLELETQSGENTGIDLYYKIDLK